MENCTKSAAAPLPTMERRYDISTGAAQGDCPNGDSELDPEILADTLEREREHPRSRADVDARMAEELARCELRLSEFGEREETLSEKEESADTTDLKRYLLRERQATIHLARIATDAVHLAKNSLTAAKLFGRQDMAGGGITMRSREETEVNDTTEIDCYFCKGTPGKIRIPNSYDLEPTRGRRLTHEEAVALRYTTVPEAVRILY